MMCYADRRDNVDAENMNTENERFAKNHHWQ